MTPQIPDDMAELIKAITVLIAASRFRGVVVILDPKNNALTWAHSNINPGAAIDLISAARQDIINRLLTKTEAEKEAFRQWQAAQSDYRLDDKTVN